MMKMMDFTKVDYVKETGIAINDEWLDGILDGYKEEDVDHLVLQTGRDGKGELTVYWTNGDCTMYQECGGYWGNAINFK